MTQEQADRSVRIPRLVIAGTASGCGKTTVTCALLQALMNRGLRPSACKCGPDYIDPMFAREIIGAAGANLDTFFFDTATVDRLLAHAAAGCDISIIEGVMGYYDGLGPDTFKGSTAEIAGITNSLVILVIRPGGAALSALAVLDGFLHFAETAERIPSSQTANKVPCGRITGVILNGCTETSYQQLASEIRKRFDGRVEVFGYLPHLPECSLKSRHLGLVTAREIEDLKQKLQRLAEEAERTVDLDGLIRIAAEAPPLSICETTEERFDTPVRIAVARDRAFCFYYENSLDVLRRMGAELIPFSPIQDASLPENADGLILGGGYPELHAAALEANTAMRSAIRKALDSRMPCIAECGGFMYLTERINSHQMVGFIRGESADTGHLTRFGYVTLTAMNDNLLCRPGETMPAHEFHHYDVPDPGNSFRAEKRSGRSWMCVHASERMYAGFPHFHFEANRSAAARFYETCLQYQRERNKPERTRHGS